MPGRYESLRERVSRVLFCRLLPLHKGRTEPDHENGGVYFQCTRCGERVK